MDESEPSIIVLHVSSAHLWLGFCTDADCQVSFPQVIARKFPSDSPVPPPIAESVSSDLPWYISESLPILDQVGSQMRTDFGVSDPIPAEINPYDPLSNPLKVDHLPTFAECACRWDWESPSGDVVVGHDALHIPAGSPFSLRWPLNSGSGRFSLGVFEGYPKSCALNDVFTIWKAALNLLFVKSYSKPAPTEYSNFSVVLVCPDDFDPSAVSSLCQLLTSSFGFASVMFTGEAITACYSWGVSSAIVVDIGSFNTKISVVEDGSSLPNTHLCMPFGLESCTSMLAHLFENWAAVNNYPSLNLSLDNPQHRQSLLNVLFTKCNALLPEASASSFSFCVHSLDGSQHTRRRIVLDTPESAKILTYPLVSFFVPQSHNLSLAPPSSPMEKGGDPSWQQLAPFHSPFTTLPLGTAVVESLMRIGRTDLRKRLLGTVLLIGGGSKLPNIAPALSNQIRTAVFEANIESFVDRIEVHVENRSNVPNDHVSWRGGAIIGMLCSNNEELKEELFVTGNELRDYGINAIREKCTFVVNLD
ncbi:hypothetical protein P9112_002998 [Eukaryota sp. TZLM1-RC]